MLYKQKPLCVKNECVLVHFSLSHKEQKLKICHSNLAAGERKSRLRYFGLFTLLSIKMSSPLGIRYLYTQFLRILLLRNQHDAILLRETLVFNKSQIFSFGTFLSAAEVWLRQLWGLNPHEKCSSWRHHGSEIWTHDDIRLGDGKLCCVDLEGEMWWRYNFIRAFQTGGTGGSRERYRMVVPKH